MSRSAVTRPDGIKWKGVEQVVVCRSGGGNGKAGGPAAVMEEMEGVAGGLWWRRWRKGGTKI